MSKSARRRRCARAAWRLVYYLSSMAEAAVAVATLVACGTTQAVRPIGRGNAAIHGSVGGPIVAISGTPIPVPILALGGGYGLSDVLDVGADADLTAAAFGVAHVTPGIAVHLLPLPEPGRRTHIPSLSLAGGLHVLTNLKDTRIAPQATAVAAFRLGGKALIYGGADAGVVFGDPTRVLAGPLIGAELSATKRLGLALELKWLAPYYDVAPLAPNWVSPGSRGYFAVLVGFRRILPFDCGDNP
jgi:hypothetical protein